MSMFYPSRQLQDYGEFLLDESMKNLSEKRKKHITILMRLDGEQ